MYEQLAQSRYVKRSGRDSNLRPLVCKSDAVTTTLHRDTCLKRIFRDLAHLMVNIIIIKYVHVSW